jgi:ABC-type microcin C transport system permease subunit YejB
MGDTLRDVFQSAITKDGGAAPSFNISIVWIVLMNGVSINRVVPNRCTPAIKLSSKSIV